jgi:hypothetical protein
MGKGPPDRRQPPQQVPEQRQPAADADVLEGDAGTHQVEQAVGHRQFLVLRAPRDVGDTTVRAIALRLSQHLGRDVQVDDTLGMRCQR